ncbi:hypothetical protein BH10PSE2_BH10PSE2_15600 [soil metagenome]
MIARWVRAVLGVGVAALAGGMALAIELTLFFLAERIAQQDTALTSVAAGLLSGAYATLFFVVGLAVIGLPALWVLGRLERLGGWTAALAGAIGATGVVMGLMLASGVTDAAILYGLYLLLPGAVAGWVLWRRVFRAQTPALT